MTRFTNLWLGFLLVVAAVTGLVGQAAGTGWGGPVLVLHGSAALALLALTPWKSRVMGRGLRRGGAGRALSIALALLVLVTIASGVLQAAGVTHRVGPLTTTQLHLGSAAAAVVLSVAHYRRHPVRPRRTDLSRRTFLRSGRLALTAGVAWISLEGLTQAAGLPGSERRFTGSHERGSFSPSQMPVSQWLDDRIQRIDHTEYRLDVAGAALTLSDLGDLPRQTITATLDCTGGWYSTQEWQGVPLDALLDPGDAASIKVTSATGYSRRFPTRDLGDLWLATHVGGAPLSAGHGAPVRLVAPGRRGFWWVKWVTSVEPSNVPWWLQSPFPLT